MDVPVALTRPVSTSFNNCELTHLSRSPIDVALAERQHAAYEAALASCGYEIVSVPVAPDLPDAVFVEDTIVVVPELAVPTRPGAVSRRAEVQAVTERVRQWRPVAPIEDPATLDGGDVLRLGQRVLVGASGRTNRAGIAQLAARLEPLGYRVEALEVHGCLHLKSAVTMVSPRTLLVNRAWIDVAPFAGWTLLDVDSAEPAGANALLAGGTVIYPDGFPRTRARLEAAGIHVLPVDVSEIAKAEGGVTCCSVLL